MKKVYLGIIASIVVVAVIVVLVTLNQPTKQQASTSTSVTPQAQASTSPSANPTGSPEANSSLTIVMQDNSFSPTQTTVKAGQSITFANRTSRQIQVDSDPHPAHTDDPELNVGTISAGQSKTITVKKTGSFGIHDHLNPSMKARVTIE